MVGTGLIDRFRGSHNLFRTDGGARTSFRGDNKELDQVKK